MKNLTVLKIFAPIALAPLFGTAYWLFLDEFQTALVDAIHGDCCARCANILYDREQPLLALCAAVAFVLAGLIDAKGLRGIFKILLVTYLAFQIYSLIVGLSVLRGEECTALHVVSAPMSSALTISIIGLLIESGFWAAFCAAPLVVFNSLRAVVFAAPDDRDPLDLGLK